MPTMTNAIQRELSNLARPAGRGEERHHVSWFIDNGLRAEFECVHPPVALPQICDKVNFDACGVDELVECYEGEEAPLHNGVIKSWWAQTGIDAMYGWVYEGAPAAQTTVPEAAPSEAVVIPPASRGQSDTPGRTRSAQLHDVRWYISEGVAEARLTCLHKPAGHCDKSELADDGLLPFTHKGGRTALRDGIIESWWTGDDWDGHDLFWKYTDTDPK